MTTLKVNSEIVTSCPVNDIYMLNSGTTDQFHQCILVYLPSNRTVGES
jgi:hypothetical protein